MVQDGLEKMDGDQLMDSYSCFRGVTDALKTAIEKPMRKRHAAARRERAQQQGGPGYQHISGGGALGGGGMPLNMPSASSGGDMQTMGNGSPQGGGGLSPPPAFRYNYQPPARVSGTLRKVEKQKVFRQGQGLNFCGAGSDEAKARSAALPFSHETAAEEKKKRRERRSGESALANNTMSGLSQVDNVPQRAIRTKETEQEHDVRAELEPTVHAGAVGSTTPTVTAEPAPSEQPVLDSIKKSQQEDQQEQALADLRAAQQTSASSAPVSWWWEEWGGASLSPGPQLPLAVGGFGFTGALCILVSWSAVPHQRFTRSPSLLLASRSPFHSQSGKMDSQMTEALKMLDAHFAASIEKQSRETDIVMQQQSTLVKEAQAGMKTASQMLSKKEAENIGLREELATLKNRDAQIWAADNANKAEIARLSQSLAAAIAIVEQLSPDLQGVKDKIAGLEASLKEANDKKVKLANDVEECGARLVRAEKLIGGLGGERSRWTESVTDLEEAYKNLIGDCLVSAGTIAYSGPFTPDFRRTLNDEWRERLVTLNIPHTPGCDVQATLSKPVEVRAWKLAGLPSDSHSIQNGIIQSKARRYPLFIDPQGQANKFIKNMGKDLTFSENGLDTIKLTDKNFLRTLENGVRFGRWVLLENIGEALDASLEPLLLQQKFKSGGTEMIRVGDSTIPWNDSFKFFLTSKLPNPHYPPEVCVKVTLLNMAITFVGLEDQLLGVAVVEEMPEMEEKKNALMIANARMKKELGDIENLILFKLSNATGNILDDHELIDTLANSKKTSQEIETKVAEAEVTENEIDLNREGYRPVAFRGERASEMSAKKISVGL